MRQPRRTNIKKKNRSRKTEFKLFLVDWKKIRKLLQILIGTDKSRRCEYHAERRNIPVLRFLGMGVLIYKENETFVTKKIN